MSDAFIPSTINNGLELPVDPAPRTRTFMPAPGEPEVGKTWIPAVLPCNTCSALEMEVFSISEAFTLEIEPVTKLFCCAP